MKKVQAKILLWSVMFVLIVFPIFAQSEGACQSAENIFDRIFSDCKIPDNGICDDGEDFRDADCAVIGASITNLELFNNMWMIRLGLLISLLLLLFKNNKFPLALGFTLLLLIYNGAFNIPKQAPISDVSCNITNLGYCFFPNEPMMGWALVGIMAFLFWRYLQFK